jgi:tRNA threonylcarbamoyladenosine biosynthesis protein TsaE
MHLADPEATAAAGAALGGLIRPGDVIALYGDLGAGKTSLARGMLKQLGLEEDAPSPSFALVIAYDPPQVRLPVWHVDLYRLESAEEAAELGLDDALYDGALLIEWPERLGSALWDHALKIHLSATSSGGRSLTADVPPSWEDRWPFQ